MNPTSPFPSCSDNTDPGLLSANAARAQILDACQAVDGAEIVPSAHAVQRVLAQDVVAPFAVPGHTNAAVDGYALRLADDIPCTVINCGVAPPLPLGEGWGEGNPKNAIYDRARHSAAQLPVIGTALAGQPFSGTLHAGQAVRITTGAVLPEGADTVIMQEHVQVLDEVIRLSRRPRLGENVRQAGEDLAAGATVLNAGRRLSPADIGLLASLGLSEVGVIRRLRVALFSTGDEVLAPGQTWRPGAVYDSNRHSLLAALRCLGVKTRDLGIVPDDPAALAAALNTAAQDSDVILSSGGVSVGAADYTKDVLARLGSVAFWKIAIKPGRPLAFGRLGGALFFGLPGNPVAVLVTYYQFVLPALHRCMGMVQPPDPLSFPARCEVALDKRPGRTEFVRGILARNAAGEYCVRPTGQQGSGILRSMSLADCFIVLPHDGGAVAAGDWVTVQAFAGLG